MGTASAIIASLALIGMVIVSITMTVAFRQAMREQALSHVHDAQRRDEQMSALLDRFQAIDWESLVALRATQADDQEGGFYTPEEQANEAASIEVDEQKRWGPLSRLRAVEERNEAEQALLAEDFPDEFQGEEPAS